MPATRFVNGEKHVLHDVPTESVGSLSEIPENMSAFPIGYVYSQCALLLDDLHRTVCLG